MYGCYTCMNVCELCVCLISMKAKSGVKAPGTRVMDAYKPPSRRWELNLDLLQEQPDSILTLDTWGCYLFPCSLRAWWALLATPSQEPRVFGHTLNPYNTLPHAMPPPGFCHQLPLSKEAEKESNVPSALQTSSLLRSFKISSQGGTSSI